jgi:hypothetical protein
MSNNTETVADDESAEIVTSGHIERTILHRMAGSGTDGHQPTTVSDAIDSVAAVLERGDYRNLGPRNDTGGTVQKSSLRRSFNQLEEKGLIRRVTDLDEQALRSDRYDLGAVSEGGDPTNPADYAKTTDDARVTDWILTKAGSAEVQRLDEQYAAELDDLAARYGRPPGATLDRIDG